MNTKPNLAEPELLENPKNVGVYTFKRVQIFYPSLFQTSKFYGGNEVNWYGLQVMLPKKSQIVTQYQKLCAKLKREYFGSRSASFPLQDGDNQCDENGMPKHNSKDFLLDHFYLKMSSKFQPKLKNYDMSDLEDEKSLYSGVYVNVMFIAYQYDNKRTGIGFNPVGVQKICDATVITSSARNLDGLFEDYSDLNNQITESQTYDIDENLPF